MIKKHGIDTFKREGKTYIDEAAESLIAGYYSSERHETISDIIADAKRETGETGEVGEVGADSESGFQSGFQSDLRSGFQSSFQSSFKLDFQPDLQPDFQDSKLLENVHLISVLENELGEKNKTIQALLQSNLILSQAMAADRVKEATRLIMRDDGQDTVNMSVNEPIEPLRVRWWHEGFIGRILRRGRI